MVEYSKVRVNLSDTQLKKLKTAVKNKTKKTKRMRLKMLHGNDLLHELLLSTRQRTKLRNTFNNNMSTDLKLSKVPLAKNILASLGITAAASVIDEVIQKKIHGSGRPLSLTFVLCPSLLTLINSSKEINDIMKIVQALENFDILLKGVTETTKNKTKKQESFLGTLVGTLGSVLLGNLLSGKAIARAGSGNKKGKGIVRAAYRKEWDF